MGIDLTALSQNVETVPFTYRGLTATVDFRPSAITAEKLAKFGDINSVDDITSYLDFLTELLVDWEVSEYGKRMEISVDSLKRVPLPMLGKIVEAVMKDTGDIGPESDGTSSDGWSPKERSGQPQAGTSSFAPHVT